MGWGMTHPRFLCGRSADPPERDRLGFMGLLGILGDLGVLGVVKDFKVFRVLRVGNVVVLCHLFVLL